MPRLRRRTGLEIVADHQLAGAEGNANRPAPVFVIVPSDFCFCQITIVIAGAAGDADRFIGLRKTHPRHAVAALLHDQAAKLMQQRGLIRRAH